MRPFAYEIRILAARDDVAPPSRERRVTSHSRTSGRRCGNKMARARLGRALRSEIQDGEE